MSDLVAARGVLAEFVADPTAIQHLEALRGREGAAEIKAAIKTLLRASHETRRYGRPRGQTD